MQAEPKKSLVGEEYEVDFGPVAHGGHCIARTAEGQVLFVRHALPGEHVVARVTEGEEGARYLRADAVTILSASKDRVEAPCPTPAPAAAAAADWQHAKPGAQRRLKGRSSPSSCSGSRASRPRRRAGTARADCPPRATSCPPARSSAWRRERRYAVDADGNAGLRRHRSHELSSPSNTA